MADRVAEALFGKTRRRVLALLFGRPDEDFYLRQVARESGASLGGVQHELARLTDAGLVTRTPRGKQVYFRANRDSPVFHEIRGLMEKTSGLADVVRVALADLAADMRIPFAFIYGSVAAGTHGSGSDVDLMIVGDVKFRDVVPVLRDAQDRLGREVNPTIYGVDEIQERLKAREHFVSRTLEGPKIMLIGNEDELTDLVG
jgi:predicted nucleotidyltransferase